MRNTVSCTCRACAWRWAKGHEPERRLAAILAADVAGYSRLIGIEKPGALQAFKVIDVGGVHSKLLRGRSLHFRCRPVGIVIVIRPEVATSVRPGGEAL